MALLLVSFAAGVLTVLSPCVLPLLPVVVGGSLAGGRSMRRALTVAASLGVSVFFFTFALKVSVSLIAVPAAVWNWLSGGILFAVGVFFLFPDLWDLVPGAAQANRGSSRLMSSGFMRQDAWGDVLVGGALGPVFSTCSPTYFLVLASVLPASLLAGTADILAYILGLCLFLLALSFLGQRVLDRFGVAADPRGLFRRGLGAIFIAVGALIVTGLMAQIEAPLYNVFDETRIEQSLLEGRPAAAPAALPGLAATSSPAAPDLSLAEKAARYEKAPELVAPDAYLNTGGRPITLAAYRGKDVVLIDFWTYSCINCQRTLPHLAAWYAKYKDQGLVIIGVHTPEFAFEHLESNVAAALAQFGISYPVVLDNEYKTWNAYGNEYWPREYLVDIDGYIVHDHAGEGDYAGTEAAIRAALAERAARLNLPAPPSAAAARVPEADLSDVGSPETYFGANRNVYLGNGAQGAQGDQTLALPAAPAPNTLYLGGAWHFSGEYAANQAAGAEIEYAYDAKDVYFVASAASPVSVEVTQDGAPIGGAAGADAPGGVAAVGASRLYHLVSNPSAGAHVLRLIIASPGLEAYTFTFG